MNRLIALSAVLVLCAPVAADDKKDVPKELLPFQGEWKIIKGEAEGKPVPEKDYSGTRFIFKGNKGTIAQNGAADPNEATFTVDPKKDPAEIDFIPSLGEPNPGIYKFEKDGTLTIRFTKSKGAVRPKAFDSKEGVLLVLEKVKK